MESETGIESILLEEKTQSFGRTYITSFPGVARLLNVVSEMKGFIKEIVTKYNTLLIIYSRYLDCWP